LINIIKLISTKMPRREADTCKVAQWIRKRARGCVSSAHLAQTLQQPSLSSASDRLYPLSPYGSEICTHSQDPSSDSLRGVSKQYRSHQRHSLLMIALP